MLRNSNCFLQIRLRAGYVKKRIQSTKFSRVLRKEKQTALRAPVKYLNNCKYQQRLKSMNHSFFQMLVITPGSAAAPVNHRSM